MTSPTLPAMKTLGPNHVCLDQNDPNVQSIAKSLPWYGPKHSPHDVPVRIARFPNPSDCLQPLFECTTRNFTSTGNYYIHHKCTVCPYSTPTLAN